MSTTVETSTPKPPLIIQRHVWLLLLSWTMAASGSLYWNIYRATNSLMELARTQARVAHGKDVLYRRWNAANSGVYAPVSDLTQPNPFLKGKERDLRTPSGRLLTLVNPAYMTRQVHALAERALGVRGHITSLNPIRPANAPDPWERKALEAFERMVPEVSEVRILSNKRYMRLMRPLATEKGCLKCHAAQGYKEGQIRGGISVAVPMKPFDDITRAHLLGLSLGHVGLWLLGLALLILGGQRLQRQIDARRRAEAEVQTLTGLLPICASCKKIREDGEWIQVDQYVAEHSEAEFTHGLCPPCVAKLYPENDDED